MYTDIFEGMTNTAISAAIDEHIYGYRAARSREILRRKIIDGETFEEIAEAVQLSRRQTQNIYYSCMEQLRKRL
jgi:DNA-directed RNA polymerase sigma subunit (sigma70/sigma32)